MPLTQVPTGLIADGAITSQQLAALAVTSAKMAAGAAVANIGAGGISANELAANAVTPAKLSQPLTQGTSQASTSGTSISFGSIPAWVKRITIMFQGVSTNGTSQLLLRLGTAGGLVSSGYLGSSLSSLQTTGLPVDDITNAAGVRHGIVTLINLSGNSWVSGSQFGRSDSSGSSTAGGSITLAGALTQIAITTVNGTDTFDAGSINILYE